MASASSASQGMMKEYIKKQLKFWVEDFKEIMLPREFAAKTFKSQHMTLVKINLKPEKVAAMLSIPPPLIVTRAFCTELHIRVPSWTAPEVFVHEPLSIRMGDLFIDLRNALECDEATRTQAMERARSATLEADPFGSIATWYAFSTTISERLEVLVDNVYIKIFVGGISRVRVELTALHARTTNALWQEMRDLVNCVDRSPDGTLKTRFKLVSCSCSVFLQQRGGSGSSESNGGGAGSLRLLHDHPIVLRMTLFSQRKSKNESWETLSQVVDVNLEKLAFDYQIAELFDVADMLNTFYKWMTDGRNGSLLTTDSGMGLSSSMMLHQRLQRSSSADSHHSTRRKQTFDNDRDGEFNEEQHDELDEAIEDHISFAAQITFRFSVQAAIHFQSERMGPQEVVLHVHNAALNAIMNQDDTRELHLTLQTLTLTFQNHVVFYLKPSREPLRLKRFRESVYVNWHLQRVECHVENDLARICNEMYHSVHEKKQSTCITCGMCQQQIPLDQIELHVCTGNTRSPASSVTSDRSVSNASYCESRGNCASTTDTADFPYVGKVSQAGGKVKLRLELVLDDFELHTDSHLFQNVQQLLQTLSPSSYAQATSEADRSFAVHMKALQLTTESKEFVGESVFVPVLPLAFQMLECTINGCGCIHKRKTRRTASSKHDASCRDSDRSDSYSLSRSSCMFNSKLSPSVFDRWPDRFFIDIENASVSSVPHNKENQDSFVKVDKIHVRTSFSDGVRVCTASQPQMSGHVAVERIRVQAEPVTVQFIRRTIAQLFGQRNSQPIEISTLFLAVLELKTIEFTLLQANSDSAHMKHLFKHVAIVADNQMGHLSYQSNFDFRMLGTSQCITFSHQQPERREDNTTRTSDKDLAPSRHERRRLRQQQEQQNAVKILQRSLRRLTQDRKIRPVMNAKDATSTINELDVSENKQDVDSPQVKTKHSSMSDRRRSSERSDSASNDKRKNSRGSSLFSSPEDLINPMKMVAAAGVITKFVKSKQQMLESEMSDLAYQSKESATRMVTQPYSACKKLLGSIVSPSSENEQSITDQMPLDECIEADEREEEDGPASLFPTVDSHSTSRHQSGEIKNESKSRVASIAHEDRMLDNSSPPDCTQSITTDEGTEEAHEQLPRMDTKDSIVIATSDRKPSAAFALCADELASLPTIVRILVQIQEQRLWVPINPRERIGVLCHEIVRRFNEMFGSQLEGEIEHVSLQDVHGGVFASSDLVGFALSLQIQENEDNIPQKAQLLFAHPIRRQSIRSLAHVNSMLQSSMVKNDPKASNTKQVGLKFSRCSKLPLPLAVALLANELERDLLHCVVKEGSYGTADSGKVDEWPDLALNASFLEPHTMLQVEVRWFGRCLEVTNVDAFVLCLQQLGLCTSRPSSKYVGKILRDRLKMDAKNTLLQSALQRSPEHQQHLSQPKPNEDEQPPDSSQHLTYENLREIVKEDCGVYIVQS